MLRDHAAMTLGAAGDFGSEALNDARQLHLGGGCQALAEPLEIAPQARVFDREFLDAGDQHPVDPLLPLKVIQAVLVEPARERQEDPSLDEEHEWAGDVTMAGESQVRLQAPVGFGTEKFRQERLFVGPVRRPAKEAIDGSEHLGVLVFRSAAARQHAPPQLIAHLIFDPAHERLDTNDVVGQNAFIVTGLVRSVRLLDRRGLDEARNAESGRRRLAGP